MKLIVETGNRKKIRKRLEFSDFHRIQTDGNWPSECGKRIKLLEQKLFTQRRYQDRVIISTPLVVIFEVNTCELILSSDVNFDRLY